MRPVRIGLIRAAILTALAIVPVVFPGCSRPLSQEERLADLNYLIDVLSRAHPYVSLKSRVEGYDWLDHRNEYELLVAEAKTDREFAAAMDRIVRLLNNAHTAIRDGSVVRAWAEMRGQVWAQPWSQVLDGASRRKADYWSRLVRQSQRQQSGTFPAVYSAGEYIVARPTLGIGGKWLPLGSRVTRVDDLDIDEFVYSLRGAKPLPYDPIRKKIYSFVLRLPVGRHSVTAELPDGTSVTEMIEVLGSEPVWPRLGIDDHHGPFSLDLGYLHGCVLDGQAGYLAIPSMAANPGQTELKALREFLEGVSDLPVLIIDIRGNGGGGDILWQTLVSMLISETLEMRLVAAVRDGDYTAPFYKAMIEEVGYAPIDEDKTPPGLQVEMLGGGFRPLLTHTWTVEPDADSVRYSGEIFLLVDDRVYSAAENFAVFSKATRFATLVGGVTGGDGVGFNLCYAVLPKSGMIVAFPLAMGINADGTINEEVHTHPDHLVEWSPEDIARWVENPGRETDIVLQACLRLAKPE